jgi:hypothetical protein
VGRKVEQARENESEQRAEQAEQEAAWLQTLLCAAQHAEFYGSLIVKMEKGSIRRVERVESLMPPAKPKRT